LIDAIEAFDAAGANEEMGGWRTASHHRSGDQVALPLMRVVASVGIGHHDHRP